MASSPYIAMDFKPELGGIAEHTHQMSTNLESLSERYDSLLGDNGINISGGQRQRISIARELYKDANLLIFDEATSALDTESEMEVQNSIDTLRGNKTIILIAHRLSTVKNCAMIFVLRGGRIVEKGTYDVLIDLGGEFSQMVSRQALEPTINQNGYEHVEPVASNVRSV